MKYVPLSYLQGQTHSWIWTGILCGKKLGKSIWLNSSTNFFYPVLAHGIVQIKWLSTNSLNLSEINANPLWETIVSHYPHVRMDCHQCSRLFLGVWTLTLAASSHFLIPFFSVVSIAAELAKVCFLNRERENFPEHVHWRGQWYKK